MIALLFLLVVSASAEQGIASRYGAHEHGHLTASGARLNNGAMTAAHKTLPLGTKVRVSNLYNGRSILVTITDRGPYIKGRIIDLTTTAAKAIGMDGLAKVTVEVVK